MSAARDGVHEAHEKDLADDVGVYKTLLESTRAIPWKIDWPSLRFAYIGPQIEALLGWTQDSWKDVQDWATRMHPEDRDAVVNFCVAQSQAGIDHEADYRALTKDGSYVWIRDVVHVRRNSAGEVDSLVGFMFDISERKKAEEELLRLHRELEALSLTDSLTGIANRRLFDQRLDIEWKDSRRSGKPLSLLLVDVDWFKPYNDTYGHPRGDECLRQIAEVLRAAARRPRDLAARLGGDEFALLLPETDEATAQEAMRELETALRSLRIPHGAGGAGAFVSASIGVASMIATASMELRAYVDHADQRLYAAKRNGRSDGAMSA
ncbi:MAG: GGDEF domain-containing protein [Silanimonas sp.]